MQQPPMVNPMQQQAAAAAMMWQMQMAGQMAGGSPTANPMMVPPWPPMGGGLAPTLNVRVDGLRFEYQLTEDDVRKVFARYGEVVHVQVDKEGTTAQVQLAQPHQTVAAQQDLDRKQLAGMSGAFLRVDFAAQPYDAFTAQMMAASSPFGAPPMGVSPPMPPYPGMPAVLQAAAASPQGAGQPKKYTCKLEVGIENLDEFRVGSRAIQIARAIWQDPKFQEAGGKTRVRGKTVGGPHEADEPLALCISCRDKGAFDKAVQYAEQQLLKVHADYKAFCKDAGKPVPDLQVKISTKGSSLGGSALASNADIPRGERPENAPTEEEIEKMIEERNEARKSANFKRADEIRDLLKERGVVLMDEKGAKGNFNGNEVTKWRYWRP